MAMELDAHYGAALKLLQGSDANFALCWISMASSFGLAVGGILLMSSDTTKRVLAVQSIAFLIAQAFTLTRVSRDWHSFKEEDLAKPTRAYFGQVTLFFIIALALAIYTLVTTMKVVEWQNFFAISVLWATVSALCLSKAVRDRHDASILSKIPITQQHARVPEVLRLCKGTLEYQIFVWASAVSAVGLMLGLMWTWDASTMVIERKGFITVCILWCEVSCFHLAKLVRDRADAEKAKDLKKQLPLQVLIVLSSVFSSGILIAGICFMPLETPKKFYLGVGSGFMLSTAFFLAKNVRDRLEQGHLVLSSLAHSAGDPPAARDAPPARDASAELV